MKSLISILFLTAFAGLCHGQKTAKQIYDENNSAVVLLEIYDQYNSVAGFGSGFIANSDGIIVTNFHVISNAYSVKIYFPDGRKAFKVH